MDKAKCLVGMDKIKKKLNNLGLNCIMTSDRENILCKSYGDASFDNVSNSSTNNSTTLPSHNYVCPDSIGHSHCPHTVCKYPKAQCHMHSAYQIGNESNNPEGDTSNKLSEKFTGCLFRIMPTDIYNGIFLHTIKLHGETCDLKMTFSYDDIDELVEVLKFLIS